MTTLRTANGGRRITDPSSREALAHRAHCLLLTNEGGHVADTPRRERAEPSAGQPEYLRLLLEPEVTSDGLRAPADDIVAARPCDVARKVPQRFFGWVNYLFRQVAAWPGAVRANAEEHKTVPLTLERLDGMSPAAIEEQEPGARIERNCILRPEVFQLVAPIVIGEIKQLAPTEATERPRQ